MGDDNHIDMEQVNNMPRHIRVEIATKIEKRVKEEIGEYTPSNNSEYQRICTEVGEEYGITRNVAACLYLGWDAYKMLNKIK